MRKFNNMVEVEGFIWKESRKSFGVLGSNFRLIKAENDGNYTQVKNEEDRKLLAYHEQGPDYRLSLLNEIVESQPRFKNTKMYFEMLGQVKPERKGVRTITKGTTAIALKKTDYPA